MRSAERRPILLRDALRTAIRRLRAANVSFGHGTTNAHDEATYLILHALKLPLDELAPHLERRLNSSERRRIENLVEKRITTRKPAAYLTREAWLGDFRFYIDQRVIVPRSYIAELLRDKVSPWIAHPSRVRTALDLCTGSGCLAILLAQSFKNARIDATDVSPAALAVARRNVTDYRLEKRVRLVRSDVFTELADRRYDVIVTNPPYVTASAMARLPREYRYEPAIALAGGTDGLEIVRRIVLEAPSYLSANGTLVVETGHARRRVERAFPRVPFVWPETSGGDDCVFVISRDELARGLQVSARTSRANA